MRVEHSFLFLPAPMWTCGRDVWCSSSHFDLCGGTTCLRWQNKNLITGPGLATPRLHLWEGEASKLVPVGAIWGLPSCQSQRVLNLLHQSPNPSLVFATSQFSPGPCCCDRLPRTPQAEAWVGPCNPGGSQSERVSQGLKQPLGCMGCIMPCPDTKGAPGTLWVLPAPRDNLGAHWDVGAPCPPSSPVLSRCLVLLTSCPMSSALGRFSKPGHPASSLPATALGALDTAEPYPQPPVLGTPRAPLPQLGSTKQGLMGRKTVSFSDLSHPQASVPQFLL